MAEIEPDVAEKSETASQIAEILQAAANHNVDALEKCLRTFTFAECETVDVQDPKTGYSPLHAAIAVCGGTTERDIGQASGDVESNARLTLHRLFENGAIWNQLDINGETPGCIAFRLGHDSLYQLMVDAGVRAEMLLNRLDGYEMMDDDNEDEEEDEVNVEAMQKNGDSGQPEQERESPAAHEVISIAFLSSTLSMDEDKLLDDKQNGVMMAWESDIMSQSADALLFEPGLRILNIGFGMGIVDSHIQSQKNKPVTHHIVEAHPEVLAEMKRTGWNDKTGVIVHEGKWQDVLPHLVADNETFDAIFFDTFAESYADFREFFSENVIGLLSQNGKWSFFNGMGADRQISYDVYQKVVELDLFESGFDVEWKDVQLPTLEKEWDGVRRRYWNVDRYRLPVCKFMD